MRHTTVATSQVCYYVMICVVFIFSQNRILHVQYIFEILLQELEVMNKGV